MPEKVKWSTSVEVQNGPTFSFGSVVQAEAYEKIQVMVAPGDAGTTVAILPDAAIEAQFLLIKASKYPPPDDDTVTLSYTVGTSEKALRGPLVLTDAAVLSLLGEDLTEVVFKTNMTDPVSIEILVCRKAGPTTTPPPP